MTTLAPAPRRTIRTILATSIMLVAALALTACQDEETRTYIDGFNAAMEELDSAADSISDVEGFEGYEQGLADLNSVIDTLEGLTPPESVSGDHDDLVAAMRAALEAAGQVTADSSAESDMQSLQQMEAAFNEASDARDRIAAELGGEED